jgi:hypothetical protein
MIDFAVCFTHNVKVQVMRKMLLFITMLFGFVTASFTQSDYYIKKAQSYQREAEYYQKKAEGYRRELPIILKRQKVIREKRLIIQNVEI